MILSADDLLRLERYIKNTCHDTRAYKISVYDCDVDSTSQEKPVLNFSVCTKGAIYTMVLLLYNDGFLYRNICQLAPYSHMCEFKKENSILFRIETAIEEINGIS